MTPLMHPATKRALDDFIAAPSHALLLLAPTGFGKSTIAMYLAGQLLGADTDKLANHPQFKALRDTKGKSISIDEAREVAHFLMLKAGAAKRGTSRVVMIEHAELLTTQAQNALLKTIEEPPAGTVLILTASSELHILPTIRSRSRHLHLHPPTAADARQHFASHGYSDAAITKTALMSDGLPGLMYALLSKDTAHPLVIASDTARRLLQADTFSRLLLVDDLAKEKQGWLDVLSMLQRMAQLALQNGRAGLPAQRRWHRILSVSHEAHDQTLHSAQLKLVVLNVLLNL